MFSRGALRRLRIHSAGCRDGSTAAAVYAARRLRVLERGTESAPDGMRSFGNVYKSKAVAKVERRMETFLQSREY